MAATIDRALEVMAKNAMISFLSNYIVGTLFIS